MKERSGQWLEFGAVECGWGKALASFAIVLSVSMGCFSPPKSVTADIGMDLPVSELSPMDGGDSFRATSPEGEIGAELAQRLERRLEDPAATRDWPGRSVAQPTPAPSVELPGYGSAVAVDSVGSQRLFSLTAENLDVKEALALFARSYDLNIVPDPGVSGMVTVNLVDLALNEMLAALLDAHGYTWEVAGNLIRVRDKITRTYVIDYLRMSREGLGSSQASLSSGMSGGQGGQGGQGGGQGGGGGGGAQGGGGGQGGAGAGAGGQGGGGAGGGSAMALTQENKVDFWEELKTELEALMGSDGTITMNETAGLVQITASPTIVRQVDAYIEAIKKVVQRQVDIEVSIYEVTLNDKFQLGINWERVYEDANTTFAGGTIITQPLGQESLSPSAFTVNFDNQDNTTALLEALKEQGDVSVVSQPKLRTLHNQTSLIKVGTETPFFNTQNSFTAVGNQTSRETSNTDVQTITVGTILALTPQISDDGWVTMDISPSITSLLETKTSQDESATAPVLDIKQVSTLVRVKNGATAVLGGLIKSSSNSTQRRIPVLGDLPGVGRLFRGEFQFDEKSELVIFLTPRVIEADGTGDASPYTGGYYDYWGEYRDANARTFNPDSGFEGF